MPRHSKRGSVTTRPPSGGERSRIALINEEEVLAGPELSSVLSSLAYGFEIGGGGGNHIALRISNLRS